MSFLPVIPELNVIVAPVAASDDRQRLGRDSDSAIGRRGLPDR
jgi:hypothetical protein